MQYNLFFGVTTLVFVCLAYVVHNDFLVIHNIFGTTLSNLVTLSKYESFSVL